MTLDVDEYVIKVEDYKPAKKNLNTWFISLINVLGTLENLNGITIH